CGGRRGRSAVCAQHRLGGAGRVRWECWGRYHLAFLQAAQSSIRQGVAAFPRLQGLLARYPDARPALPGSISRPSRLGLDWMNFFLADVQTGFGAFVAFYLAELGWSKGQVGLALAVGTLSGVASQIPGGALIDALPWKRALAAAGIAMICASALILA